MNTELLEEFIVDSQAVDNSNDVGTIEELKTKFPKAVPYSSGLGVVLIDPKTGKSLRVNFSHGVVGALKDKSISMAQVLTFGTIGKTLTGNDPDKPRLTLRLPQGFNGSIDLEKAIAAGKKAGAPTKEFKLEDSVI